MPRFVAVIGQPPPFALSRPTFRFPALVALAGSMPLGGNRESAIACLIAARLASALLPPYAFADGALKQRSEQARTWVASLAVPSNTRQSFLGVARAVGSDDRGAAVGALHAMVAVVRENLDENALRELADLARELEA